MTNSRHARLKTICVNMKLPLLENVPLVTTDRAEIADWALDGVDYCYTGGLVPEKFRYVLSPKAFVRRGEIADVLYRFCMWEEGKR